MRRNLILFIILVFHISVFGKDLRIEPSFWWVGMKNPNLQLIVYGTNISELTPIVHYDGVTLVKVSKVENKNYLFINLQIDKKTLPGRFDIDLMKGEKKETCFTYELLNRESGSFTRTSFNTSDVIYLISPDRFSNGNKSNDSISGMREGVDRQNENGRHGGDIQGIINHLDFIHDMGYTSIWITPVLENNQPNYSYHGYAITDFYKVDPRFGSNELYKELSESAKKKGIKLIMDMVFNHCGSEHWWMKDLPSKDWINFSDTLVFTSHKKTVLQDPHVSPSDYKEMVDGWFTKLMPDLNQRNALLSTYLIQNSIWWVEYAGLAGIRVDTYSYPDSQFMSNWTCRVMEEYPNLNIVGEEWNENPAIVSYWQKGKVNANGYMSCLPGLMDFPLQSSFNKGLTESEQYNNGFIKPYEVLANDFLYPNSNNLVVFPDNHDMPRFYTQVLNDKDLVKIGLAFYLTTRGIPQIFYGTEMLLTGSTHGQARCDFPGGWTDDSVNVFTETGLSPEQSEVKDFMKKLLNWRKNSSVIANGKLMHYAPKDGVYVYFRYSDDKKVMVILNKNDNASTVDLKRFSEMLNGTSLAIDAINGSKVELCNKLKVPAKSPMILELNN